MGESDVGSTLTRLRRLIRSCVSSSPGPTFVFWGEVRSNNQRSAGSRSSLHSPFLGDVNHVGGFHLGAQSPYVCDNFIVELIP